MSEALGFEALVDFYLITAGQTVGLVGHAHYRHQFVEHPVRIPALRAPAVCDAMQ